MSRELEDKLAESWIRKSFNDDKCDITISSRTGGYLGDIIFAKVTVNQETHHVAIKIGKKDSESRKLMPIAEAVQREKFFYNDILPTFYSFQKEKNIKEPFDAVPKCYTTFPEESIEVIILENLKCKGFELHRGSVPLNVSHLKMGLKNLAKFHGLSFGLCDQKKEVFDKLTQHCKYVYRSHLDAMKTINAEFVKNVIKILNDVGRKDLSRKYEKFVENGVSNLFLEIFDDEPKERVVTHCDCHNYNFFFKYTDNLKEKPSQMKFIDFQISCLHSPVLDLSYFWYTGASENEISHFVELMEFYHQQLSIYLKELGSDPEKIFPLSKLWDHWKIYSKFGFLMSSLYMKVLLFDREANALEEEFRNNTFNQEQLKTTYQERLKTIVDHYFNNTL